MRCPCKGCLPTMIPGVYSCPREAVDGGECLICRKNRASSGMPATVTSRTYIETTPIPNYVARDISETIKFSDGEERRSIILSFPRGTPPEAVPDALKVIREAYENGRRDERGVWSG